MVINTWVGEWVLLRVRSTGNKGIGEEEERERERDMTNKSNKKKRNFLMKGKWVEKRNVA